jgi:hypothetical protein
VILNDIEIITEHDIIIIIIIIIIDATEMLQRNSVIPQPMSAIACTSRYLANHRN